MKQKKTTYNKKKLLNLRAVAKKMEYREFKRHYVLNKDNEWVKRSFGGQHVPSPGSNRRNAKRSHFHHL